MSARVELYRFVEGDLVFTQTSGAEDIEYNGETYTAEPGGIGRGQAEVKSELTRANLDLVVARTNPLAQRWLARPVDRVVTVTVFVQEEGETNAFWRGRLTHVKASKQEATLVCESFFTSLNRPGLRARYQRTCRHSLYGRGCRLDPENFRHETTVVSMDGVQVTVASVNGAAVNTYRSGMIRAPDLSLRFILKQVGTILTLSRPFETLADGYAAGFGYGNAYGDLYGGLGVVLYPGCAHTPEACLGFDNLDNYGGFPYIPTKNPFGGSSIM